MESSSAAIHTRRGATLVEWIALDAAHRRFKRRSNTAVSGRISPFGTAIGLTDAKLLFYSWLWGLGTKPSISFASLVPKNDRVWVEVDISLNVPLPSDPFGVKFRQVGSFRFNANDEVIAFDLTMPYAGPAMAVLGIDFRNPFYVAVAVNAICTAYVTSCNSTNDPSGLFNDVNDCRDFLLATDPGSMDTVNQNTVACRAFQTQRLGLFPNSACRSIGRTGGNACVNRPYSGYFSFFPF